MDPSHPNLRAEDLRKSWREFQSTGEEAEELATDLTRAQLWWRPEPQRWSIGECLDHLVRTGEAYLDVLDAAVDEGRRRELFAAGPYPPSLVGRWLARILEPPPRLKVPAPRRIRPAASPGAEEAEDPLPRFLGLRAQLRERLEAADGLDLGRIRVASPFVPILKFDLGSAFRIVAAHERRHLWQARRVRDEATFP